MTVFLVALLLSFLLTPLVARLSLRWGIADEPGGRRRHEGRIARLGGGPLLLSWLAAIAVAVWLMPPSGDDVIRLRGVVLGTLLVFIGGLLDDRWDLPPGVQFVIQGAGAAVAMGHIIFIELFTNPFPGSGPWLWPPLAPFFSLEGQLVEIWRPLALLLTLFWMMGMMNTVNWLDGLDGLAAGVGVIAAVLFAWHSYTLEQHQVALFPLALAGALLGFLPHNFAPARIFLGTAGVYLLGYQLATLAILSPAKIATALLVMALPILDVLWLIIDRLRRGRSPLRGDRRHLHFRLADRGWPVRAIVLGYYLVAVSLGLVVVLGPTPQIKLTMLLGLGTLILVLLVWSSRHEEPAAAAVVGESQAGGEGDSASTSHSG